MLLAAMSGECRSVGGWLWSNAGQGGSTEELPAPPLLAAARGYSSVADVADRLGGSAAIPRRGEIACRSLDAGEVGALLGVTPGGCGGTRRR